MKNQINTSEGNVQLMGTDGKMTNVHPSHVYAVFNVDTVSFLLIAMPKSSGLAVFTSTAEDLLVNGQSYSFEELKTVIPEEFAEAGAQARCEIVDELPATGKTNTIYLVPKPSGQTGYDEYIYIKDQQKWELVGDTSIEMENYLLKTDFYTYSAATEVTITALSGAISDEASRAISAESALSDSIDALNLYIDEVSGITDTLDGDIDILEESLAQEASARTDADTVLSGAISSVTEDVAALSGDVTAHTSNTDIHVTVEDKANWDDKYTQVEVDGIVSGLNDSIDAVSGAVDDEVSARTAADEALGNDIITISGDVLTIGGLVDTVSGDLSTHVSNTDIHVTVEDKTNWNNKADADDVYDKDEIDAAISGMATQEWVTSQGYLTEHQDISGKQDVSGMTAYTTTAVTNALNSVVTAHTGNSDIHVTVEDKAVWNAKAEVSAITDAISDLSGTVDTALLGYVNDAEYDSSAKTINLLNGQTVIAQVDATAFIKDGMVDNVAISGGNLVITFNTDSGKEAISIPLTDIFDPSNYYTKSQVDDAISAATSGKSDSSALTAHTSNTDIHVTAADKTAWSGKQNALTAGSGISISGDVISVVDDVVELTQDEYDALVDKDPNVFYIITDATEINMNDYYKKSETSGATEIANAISAATDDMATQTWVGQQGYLTQHQDISGKQDVSGMTAYTTTATTSALNDVVTAHTANTDVHVTTADKANWADKYTKSEVDNAINAATSGKADSSALATKVNITDNNVSAFSGVQLAIAENTYYGDKNIRTIYIKSIGRTEYTDATLCLVRFGNSNATTYFTLSGSTSGDIMNGGAITAYTINHIWVTHSLTNGVITVTFNDPQYYLQSVENVQNDIAIYYTKGEYSSGQTADVVENTVYDVLTELGENLVNTTNKIDTTNFVTTKTEQTISGRKIFTYIGSGSKAIEFKQTTDSAKVGFTIRNSADTNNEVASFEFRPNTFTIDGVKHPLMYFGHYRNTNIANAGVPQTVIGFRQYDQANAAALHYLIPLPEKAKRPFSLTTSFKNFYAPLGFKNGSTIIKADETGVVDLTSEFSGKADTSAVTAVQDSLSGYTTTGDTNALSGTVTAHTADTAIHVTSANKTSWDGAVTASSANTTALGGLKLVKISQSDYDGLTTKDSNTIYVING